MNDRAIEEDPVLPYPRLYHVDYLCFIDEIFSHYPHLARQSFQDTGHWAGLRLKGVRMDRSDAPEAKQDVESLPYY